MKKIIAIAFAILVIAASPAFAEIKITNVVAEIEDGGREVAVFMTITNTSEDPDVLYSAKTGDAKEIKIMSGNMGGDHSAASGIGIPAKGSTELKEGAAHIALEELASPPKSGDTLEVILFFEEAGKITVKPTIK